VNLDRKTGVITKRLNIALIPADSIGPEVISVGIEVCRLYVSVM
jgi:isocitrate/isopropylmalate dehydrogenase